MNLADIRAFVVLAETGSINRAAARLGLTQPATTRRIQNFEASFAGAALLDRRVKPPILTPAGRHVLGYCQRVLKSVADLEACAADGGTASHVRIGVSPGLAEPVLSTPLDQLRSQFPKLQLHVTSEWTGALIRKLGNCELDCVVAFVTDDHRLPSTVSASSIAVEPLRVVSSRRLKAPSGQAGTLRIQDLEPYGWVVNPVGCAYREALLRAFDRSGASCRLDFDVLGYDVQLSLIARGCALGLVPRRVLDRSPWRSRLRVLDVIDFKPRARVVVLRSASLGRLEGAVDCLERQLSVAIKRTSFA